MITFTAIIDKLTRIFIATLLLVIFSNIKFNLIHSIYTFELFIITAICIILPFLEFFSAWIIFAALTFLNIFPFEIAMKQIDIGIYNYNLLIEAMIIGGIIPIIIFGIIKRYRFTQNYYTDTFLGVLISWLIYAIFVSAYYTFRSEWLFSTFFSILNFAFTKNILIYISKASILIVLLPSIWKRVDGKRKKVRMLSNKDL